LTLIAIPAFRFWAYLLRADLIGIAISLSGLALFATRPRYKHWSLLFFAAAIFCKFTLLAAPLAALCYLAITRQIKESARFAAFLALAVGGAFAILQTRTGGGFAFHMFSTHADPYSFAKFAALAAITWFSAPLITGLAMFHLGRSIRSAKPDVAVLYFLTSSITSLSAGKLGATTNHFLEWMVAACWCAGMGYGAVKQQYPRRLLPITLALVLSTAVGVFVQNRPAQQPYSELTECSKIYDYVARAQSSRILSQSLGPLLLAHKPVLLTDLFAYNHLVQHHLWSDDALVRLLDEKYFAAILTTVDPQRVGADARIMWPPTLLDAISRHYHVAKRFNCRDSSLILEPDP
jgi:hypothetical protein